MPGAQNEEKNLNIHILRLENHQRSVGVSFPSIHEPEVASAKWDASLPLGHTSRFMDLCSSTCKILSIRFLRLFQVRYQCQLKIASLGQEMTQEATSKKSAQTNVAWAYIDWLIQKGMVNPSELPPRPDAQNQNTAYNQQVASQAVAANDARYGGWTTENARQRLNRFCVQQGITCNIINQVGGTPQQKITTADLVLNVNGKELRAHAQVQISYLAGIHEPPGVVTDRSES